MKTKNKPIFFFQAAAKIVDEKTGKLENKR